MRATVTLSPEESKRLIAMAIVRMEVVKQAKKEGIIGLARCTSCADGAEECEILILDVCASFSSYQPAVMYLRNGDPGYPAEGGEVEEVCVVGPDGIEWDSIPEALLAKLEDMAIDESSR